MADAMLARKTVRVAGRPFPLWTRVPLPARPVILDAAWDQGLLWTLDLPTVEVPVEDLAWHLRLPLWRAGGRPFAVAPLNVASHPERFPDQYARTLTADLGCPIHMLGRPERLTILDGIHRLLKAHL